MKNLLMLSIFQTYSELVGDKVIFGIEEPEIYLYPHAQRALYKNLISLSETSQIFYTTHNPNFVSAARPQDVIILRKDVEEGTYFLEKSPLFSKETAESYWHKIYTNFNNERNEIFFSNKVILVEGASDKVLLETLCSEKWDVDLDECGYSIVECGGKNGVKYFVGVAKLIGLDDYYAVWDQDEEVLHADDLLKEVLDNEKGFEFLPDMESALGIEKGSGDEKVLRAHEWASSINVADIPALFSGVKIFLSENENEE
jgi:predicted ATP-dependent endonuclease of OLD family